MIKNSWCFICCFGGYCCLLKLQDSPIWPMKLWGVFYRVNCICSALACVYQIHSSTNALPTQMVYLIRPPNIAGNVDELLHLWIFIYLKYSDLCFTPQDAYTSCLACALRPSWQQCCRLKISCVFLLHSQMSEEHSWQRSSSWESRICCGNATAS